MRGVEQSVVFDAKSKFRMRGVGKSGVFVAFVAFASPSEAENLI